MAQTPLVRRTLSARAMSPSALLFILAFLVLSTACGSKEGQLTGEVFIVTRGGQNVRLGLVEVRAIPAETLTPFIIAKMAPAKEEELNAPEYFFEGLPVAVASAMTDADGKFSMTLNRKQRYALAAHATRNIGDTTEKYFWLFWVSLDGKGSKRILISNDTLFEVPHADAVVRWR